MGFSSFASISPPTMDQVNPGMDALKNTYDTIDSLTKAHVDAINSSLTAQYAPQMAQQALQKALYDNQVAKANAQTQLQKNLADIYTTKQQGGMYGAEASAASAQAALTRGRTPYEIQQAAANVYSDPIIQRSHQLSMALQDPRTAAILQSQGLGGQQQQQMPGQGLPQGQQGGGLNQVSPGAVGATPLTAPKAYSGDALSNYLMFGSPLSPMQQAAMKTQATGNITNYNDAINKAQDDAISYNQMSNLADQYTQGMKKALYKGPALGQVPSAGWSTTITGLNHDFSPEQQVDNAAKQMNLLNLKTSFGGRITNYEALYGEGLKPGRAMTDETAALSAGFLKAKALRGQEYQPFLTAAMSKGIPYQIAQSLWGKYQTQYPTFNFTDKKANTQLQNKWSDFLTPEAVNAVQNGQPYAVIPSGYKPGTKAFEDWFVSLSPADRNLIVQQERGSNAGQ